MQRQPAAQVVSSTSTQCICTSHLPAGAPLRAVPLVATTDPATSSGSVAAAPPPLRAARTRSASRSASAAAPLVLSSSESLAIIGMLPSLLLWLLADSEPAREGAGALWVC